MKLSGLISISAEKDRGRFSVFKKAKTGDGSLSSKMNDERGHSMFLDLASPMEGFMYEYGTLVVVIAVVVVAVAAVLIIRAVRKKKK